MIAQFPSRCGVCREPIAAGTDIHYANKKATHWDCWESQPPEAKTVLLAERLGFLPESDARIFDWTTVPTRGDVRELLDGDRGPAARWPEATPHPQQTTLPGLS